MKDKIQRIINGCLLGLIGFSLGIVVSPLIAIASIIYMTKSAFEVGFKGDQRAVDNNVSSEIIEEYES